uniref:Uncharacterized protein n=1 Tax=Pseudomonas fluorescens (strain SBW25) TaxID=216595 RepID=A0A0G4E4J8_PSEFS|nr:hypothetical protein PQBR57_0136 [Pseudomonas fluorescens SBW25]
MSISAECKPSSVKTGTLTMLGQVQMNKLKLLGLLFDHTVV